MTVDGLVAVVMQDPDKVTVTAAAAAPAAAVVGMRTTAVAVDDRTGIRRVDRGADRRADIDRVMALVRTLLAVFGGDDAGGRPCPASVGLDLLGSAVIDRRAAAVAAIVGGGRSGCCRLLCGERLSLLAVLRLTLFTQTAELFLAETELHFRVRGCAL